MLPTAALVLPTFLEINYAHLVNTPPAVVLPYSFFPFGVYLTYIYFAAALPADLIAAAKIDGCGEFAAFFRIALPVVALVGFFSFVGIWNNFFLPYVMLPGSGQGHRVRRARGLPGRPAGRGERSVAGRRAAGHGDYADPAAADPGPPAVGAQPLAPCLTNVCL